MVLFGGSKNSEGQTVNIATGGITTSEGEISNAYLVVCDVAPCTYTVLLFPISVPYGQPVSVSVMGQVSV